MLLKRFLVIALSFFMVMLIAACGSSTTTGGGSSSTATTSPATATTSPATATPTTGSSSSAAVIQTTTAPVKGKSETILTDTKGRTLYYFTADSATKAACTGGCVQTWPPLLFTGSGQPTSSTSLSGKLSVQTDANGSQVEYNGHPLYTYAGDTASGQTNGEGLFGKWFVATPNLSVQSGGASNGSYYGQ